MNFNPNNQNTLLTKKVAALYEAMQKAGDSGLAFMVVDSLNSLANYARFLAEQEILIQQARITMDAASYRIFYHSVDSARTSLLENAAANVALLNRLCKKYNTDQIAGNVADAIEAEMNSGNMYSLANSPAYTAFAKEEVQIQHARFTMDGEEFRQYVMELDRHRRALHEGLMARVNFANRLCVKLNTPVLAERVTEENRETYFAFAKEVVDSYFGEAMQNGRLL